MVVENKLHHIICCLTRKSLSKGRLEKKCTIVFSRRILYLIYCYSEGTYFGESPKGKLSLLLGQRTREGRPMADS